MSDILEELKVSGKDELEYVKSLHLDPDFDKIDVNSGEDLLTQLARIKGVDVQEVGARMVKTVRLHGLKEKYYSQLCAIRSSKEISIADKLAVFGRTPRSSWPNKLVIFCTMAVLCAGIVAVFLTFIQGSLVASLISFVLAMLYVLCANSRAKWTRTYHTNLCKIYFKVMGR